MFSPGSRPTPRDDLSITVLSQPEAELADIRAGLMARPRRLPSKYFYDERGSRLFDRICGLPEYYLTRTEQTMLARLGDHLADVTGAEEVLEIGPGSCRKTRVVLDALERRGSLRRYWPLDISKDFLCEVAEGLADEYDALEVHGLVGDFTTDLEHIPTGRRRLAMMLGSTIGNFELTAAAAFLRQLSTAMRPGESLLLGTDLIKDAARLEAAYNDSRGVTAEFNRNILRVLNRLLDGDFAPEAFRHRATYSPGRHRVEMWLVAERPVRVSLPAIELELAIDAGDGILTEICIKYDRGLVAGLLEAGGFELLEWHTDPEGLFALSVARKGS